MSNTDKKREYRPILSDITDREGAEVCAGLRKKLVEDVSLTGGHLASNLGAVELTVAIHRVFDTRTDRLVFDVGHQCYSHKILTGRGEKMNTLRQYGGIAGFPKPNESEHDAFIAGHASNSVAVSLGMAQAREALGENYKVIALIGDGALTGGLAYEGLSNAGQYRHQLLVILNDNGMSITPNVGAVAEHLAKQRMKPQYLTFKRWYRKAMRGTRIGQKTYWITHRIKQALKQSLLPCSMFENMGFNYLGPVDGHDLARLTKTMQYAKEIDEPVLIHVKTKKGKGYLPAEENPDAFHGVSPFDPETGVVRKSSGDNFSAVFGRKLAELAKEDPRICAITAAMMSGTGLEHVQEAVPERFYDVGIAEGCAVSVAAGMAKQGAVPVFAVYSTFLQRAYDMLVHDVAIDNLHVVLAVDRAGLVGEDGETHHGVMDVAYLDSIPNMTVFAPSSFAELEGMLEYAVKGVDGPVAIRYPRGAEGSYRGSWDGCNASVLKEGKDISLVGYGVGINDLLESAELLEKENISAEVIKMNVLTPSDMELVYKSAQRTNALLVVEDSVDSGSMGQRIYAALQKKGLQVKVDRINCGNRFVAHGALGCLKKELYLDAEGIAKKAMEVLGRG